MSGWGKFTTQYSISVLQCVDHCALKADVDNVSDLEVHMEAERIVIEAFVHQQQMDASSHSDILILDSDVAESRLSSSKKSQKKHVKQKYIWAFMFSTFTTRE